MEEKTLAWNIPNFISVTVMVIVTFAVVGLILQLGKKFAAGGAPDTVQASA